jgi:hypothetical protein
MPLWLQHLLVLLAVAAALVIIVRQALATLRAGKGGFGSCCAKGCAGQSQQSQQSQPRRNASPDPPPQRIAFLPVESLTRRRR